MKVKNSRRLQRKFMGSLDKKYLFSSPFEEKKTLEYLNNLQLFREKILKKVWILLDMVFVLNLQFLLFKRCSLYWAGNGSHWHSQALICAY
jgi:hypothetical protein